MRGLAPFLVLVSLTLVACGIDKQQAVVGKWKGSVNMTKEELADPVNYQIKQDMEALEMDIKADHTVVAGDAMGTWAVNEDVLTVTPTKVFGKDVSEAAKDADSMATANPVAAQSIRKRLQPQHLTIASDGKTLTLMDDSVSPLLKGKAAFVKE